jgi:hypothetical protein
VITIDFGTEDSCTSGYEVMLNEGIISIGSHELVSFESPFKDVVFIMSNCNDKVFVNKTHGDASSIEIEGADGDDIIVIGVEDEALEACVFANIIVDGGQDNDVLTVHDESSSSAKSVEIRYSLARGLHTGTNETDKKTISYLDVEDWYMNLGTAPANATVFSTPKDSSFTLTTQGKVSGLLTSSIFSPKGPSNHFFSRRL